jgi:hypothetical protein
MSYQNFRFLFAALILSFPLQVNGQSQEKVFGSLILKLARGTQWPNEAMSKSFVIGVLSYSPLADELRVASQNIKKGTRPFVVREIASAEESIGCDLVFIPSFKSKTLPAVVGATSKKPTMIITNKVGLMQSGSTVNLLFQEGKFQFEISEGAVARQGFKVSTEVKGLGIIKP